MKVMIHNTHCPNCYIAEDKDIPKNLNEIFEVIPMPEAGAAPVEAQEVPATDEATAFVCSVCGYAAKDSRSLKIHTTSKHGA